MFPSYLEGFGFGVLEMLAASLPVIAYDVPGPPMMLSDTMLVPAGDTDLMTSKLVALLTDQQKLIGDRAWARRRSRDFLWKDIAVQTSDLYKEHLASLLHAREGVITT